MKTVFGLLIGSASLLLFNVLVLTSKYATCLHTDFKLCHMCEGMVHNNSAVWSLCQTVGQLEGRCCFEQDKESILGLDLSNCSLSHIDNLQEASTAVVIDLSSNPISNLSDVLFKGFNHLTCLILPVNVECPGGNGSWDKMELKPDSHVCEGQRNFCNQTGHIAVDCPVNSLCMPYGPGFFQCSCAHNFHGYKCLREGSFPMLEATAILGGTAVIVSTLLWVTQRRKAKRV